VSQGAPAQDSPLLPLLLEAGGVPAEYHGRRLVRHFGDLGTEYRASVEGVAVFDRGHRTRLVVSGRAPGQMLSGIVTGVIPASAQEAEPGVKTGVASYHAVLTPKGRMISDCVMLLPDDEQTTGFLLDVPVAGREGLLAHFARFLPPRFAAVTDVSSDLASISVVGPGSTAALAKLALGLAVDSGSMADAEEGRWWAREPAVEGLVVSRSCDVWPTAWTVYGPKDSVAALWRALRREGAVPAGLGVWKTLGVEAGRPVFGTDMDEDTLPPEAGIVDRAIDQTKGCYTGQEVIVRIRDRGHVNRHLRRLLLGDVPAPAPGTELSACDDAEKVVGRVTSSVQSPRFGGVAALAYIRRGVRCVRLGDLEMEVPEGFPEPADP
jgi:folate-binding protein YgfZ